MEIFGKLAFGWFSIFIIMMLITVVSYSLIVLLIAVDYLFKFGFDWISMEELISNLEEWWLFAFLFFVILGFLGMLVFAVFYFFYFIW